MENLHDITFMISAALQSSWKTISAALTFVNDDDDDDTPVSP